MTDVERKRKAIINVIYYGMILFLSAIVFKYAMGTLFPILFAYIIAAILQKPKNFLLRKTPLKKGFASTVCVLGLLAVAVFLISLIGVRIASEVKGFIDYIVLELQNIDEFVNTVESSVMSLISNLPDFIGDALREGVATLFTQLREWLAGSDTTLPDELAGTIGGSFSLSWITTPISGVISTARQIPSVVIAAVIALVAACFMTADFNLISEFVICQFPPEKAKDFIRAKTLLKSSLGKMGKAYLAIICITFAELSIGLSILSLLGVFSSNYIAIISFVTAIIDIIPILGTGTILLPWTAYSLIVGNYGMAIGLGILYATITVIRQIIEPKFVAAQLGLPPFLTICIMYIGLKFIGVLGMFIAPMIVVMLKLLNDEGILHLWKSPSKVNGEPIDGAEETGQSEEG